MLDRVLGGQHPEGLGENDRFVADGDLALLHGLQERTLHLGRCAVDLVGQEDGRDDRPGANVKSAGGGTVDLRSGQVGGEQVGGELDAAKREVECLGQGTDRPRLGEARHALDQDVAAGQERDHQPFQQGPLSDHQVFHPLDEQTQSPLGRGDRGEAKVGGSSKEGSFDVAGRQ